MDPDKTKEPEKQPQADPQPAAPSEDLTEVKDALATITEKIETLEEKIPEPVAEEEPKPSWKPLSWDDIPKLVEEKGREVAEAVIEERTRAVEETRRVEEEKNKAIDAEIDAALLELEGQGKLPKIENPEDPNDLGRAARQELFGLGVKLGTLNLKEVAEVREQLHEAGVHYDAKAGKYLKSNPSPWGASAPVGSSNRVTEGAGKPSYNEIHNLSMDQLARKFGG